MGFQCLRCGNCCRHAGEVCLDEDETHSIAAALELCVDDFIQRYTRLSEDRRGLSLIERPDHACVFLDEPPAACRIQTVKPRQCRDFPARWRYADLPAVCAGARASQEFRPP